MAVVLGDWGTTRLRLWRMERGVARDRRDGPGIGALERSPAETLEAALAPWLAGGIERIVLCGMAGARGGLHEAPYADCPAGLAEWRASIVRSAFRNIPLWVAAGLACQGQDTIPDVMRGEETQLYGALALHPVLGLGRQCVILPGTHSKWAMVEDGRITGFRTFLTGELFGLLCRSSLLAAPGGDVPGDEAAGFTVGMKRARDGSGLLGHLFEARAAQLRNARKPGWARGFLSGLVIGSEVTEMLRAGQPGPITIIGDPELAARYEQALACFGAEARREDGDDCVLAGLRLLDADD